MAMQFGRHVSTGAYRLRGTFQQAAVRDFLYEVPRRLVYGSSDASVARPAPVNQFQKGLCTTSFSVNNRSGSAGVLGFGYCWDNELWVAGQWDDGVAANADFIDDSADAKTDTAGSFPLSTPLAGDAANDGWVIASPRPFSWISLEVSTASEGNTTMAVRYSNAAGTGWTTIAANQTLVSTAAFSGAATVIATGEHLFCWNPPSNWGRVNRTADGAGLFSTIPDGWYALGVTIDAATYTVLPLAAGIEIGSMVFSPEAIADNASGSEDNITYQDYDAIGVVALLPAATIGSNVDFATFSCG